MAPTAPTGPTQFSGQSPQLVAAAVGTLRTVRPVVLAVALAMAPAQVAQERRDKDLLAVTRRTREPLTTQAAVVVVQGKPERALPQPATVARVATAPPHLSLAHRSLTLAAVVVQQMAPPRLVVPVVVVHLWTIKQAITARQILAVAVEPAA